MKKQDIKNLSEEDKKEIVNIMDREKCGARKAIDIFYSSKLKQEK